ncbi:MAG: outer membrane protein transport protein [Ignavibacterium sp.]|nr:outer membrane protein transport protein [Ignavibacterium sp.]MCX7611412.1 outer membrane protein transport protein [Ignavibacterium sp.]MDW8375234.1 outer membrane protein transport protein [Ignavibacteriales bacterium]
MRKITYFAMLICFSSLVFAGGFQLNQHGAKASGMSGAFTAVANDPSAVYWNPGGLAHIKGTHFMLSSHFVSPFSSFRGISPNIDEYKTVKRIFYPTNFFASHSFSDDLAVGFGFTVPFGLGTKWDDNWVGKYLALESRLQIFTLQPTISYKVNKHFSIGAGLVFSFANVLLVQKTPQTPFEGDAKIKLEGKDNSAFGFNIGVMYSLTEDLTIGAAFQSGIEYNFKGTAKTEGAQELINTKRLPSGDVTANLSTPFNSAIGIAYKINEDWIVSSDFQYVGWSSYDVLRVDFADLPTERDIASPRLYNNSYVVRFGTDYKFNEELSLRGGFYFDKKPVDDDMVSPSLPETDRLGFTVGAEYKLFDNLSLRGSFLYIRGNELKVNNSKQYITGNTPFNGVYNVNAYVLSFGLLYSL